MTDKIDQTFYDRADTFIAQANQLCDADERGKVSASMMYATARFNAWVTACGFQSEDQMRKAKEEIIEYFVNQYRAMLDENLEDYAARFSKYMEPEA